MTWLPLAAYGSSLLLLLGVLFPYLQMWLRNRGQSRPYMDRMLLEHCHPLLSDGERVLVASRRGMIWQMPVCLACAAVLPLLGHTWQPKALDGKLILFLASLLGFGLMLLLTYQGLALKTKVVVTNKAVYSCDFRAATPEVATILLQHDTRVLLEGDCLHINGNKIQPAWHYSNRAEVFSAILDAIAALPPSPPPARPPS